MNGSLLFSSRYDVHNRGDQGISRCFVVALPIDTKTLGAAAFGEAVAQIAEGVFGVLVGGIAPGRSFFEICRVDPMSRLASGGQREIELVRHGIRLGSRIVAQPDKQESFS